MSICKYTGNSGYLRSKLLPYSILVYALLALKNILCISASSEMTHQSHCIFFLTVSHEVSGHRNFSVLWTSTLYQFVRLICGSTPINVTPDALRFLKNIPLSKIVSVQQSNRKKKKPRPLQLLEECRTDLSPVFTCYMLCFHMGFKNN